MLVESFDMGEKIFFCHIPKTAGTSFVQSLSTIFDEKYISKSKLLTDIAILKEDYQNLRLISGHFGIDDIGRDKLAGHKKVTFLRDPVSRVISLYYFWNSHKDKYSGTPETDPNYKAVTLAISCNLEEFLNTNDPEIIAEISNTQCRYIAGSARFGLVRFGDRLLLHEAIRAVEQDFDFVGIVEKYERSLVRFNKKFFGDKKVLTSLHSNTNHHPKRKTHSKAVIEKIVRMNAADIALYSYIKNKDNGINNSINYALALISLSADHKLKQVGN